MEGSFDMSETVKEVAILLATYNGEKYVAEQLQSLKEQSFQNFICYIHDDNSSDRTVSIVKEFEERYPGQFKLVNYEGGHGAVGNFMSLARYVRNNTKEPYIMFCDQDDYWYPTKIEKELNLLKKSEKPSKPFLVYCDQEIVDGNLNIIAKSGMDYSKRKSGIDDSFKELVFENCAAGCTIGINRCCLDLAINSVVENHIIMHDWWFMLIARCFGDIGYVDESLMKYRQHGTNTLGADNKILSGKIRKYMRSLKRSMIGKANHVRKCEMQIKDIKNAGGYQYIHEIENIVKVLEKHKIQRMIYFYTNKYIKKSELFTLLFV